LVNAPRKRAVRHKMPPSDMSLSDPQDATQNVYVLSKGADFPETWSKKTLEPPNPSLTSKVPARSALRSILIAAACTSSLMITTGLGSALTISLPYAGDDLHIPKNDLQWILSAFSISSVGKSSCGYHLTTLWLTLRIGLLPSPLRTTCRSLWAQTRLAYWILDHGGVWPRRLLRAMYVAIRLDHAHFSFFGILFFMRSLDSARRLARATRVGCCCNDSGLCNSPRI